VFANELARRYGDQGIVSTSVHPGLITTDLFRDYPRFLLSLGVCRCCSYASRSGPSVYLAIPQAFFVMHPASQGAVTQLWAGTSAEGAELGGKVAYLHS
jgi:NAD(P)-dependent dehydrogenase (short-subunit alcohol dehydrogenase family)